jgi:hypothetical protein
MFRCVAVLHVDVNIHVLEKHVAHIGFPKDAQAVPLERPMTRSRGSWLED